MQAKQTSHYCFTLNEENEAQEINCREPKDNLTAVCPINITKIKKKYQS